MDSLITAAARALAAGDPFAALNRVALRGDPPALALRGIAMAQLGDLDRAKTLLKSAARAFGAKEAVARARCIVAEAEIALVSRDLGWSEKALDEAGETLSSHGDRLNAAHATNLKARRLLLIGRLDEAERTLARHDANILSPALLAVSQLTLAGIATRRLQTARAHAALAAATKAAGQAGIAALADEIEAVRRALSEPCAFLVSSGARRPLRLDEVEALLAAGTLVVDGCRNVVRGRDKVVSLASRPVLLALARALGEAWPREATREALIARAFGARFTDESHRGRLRVEIARLRAALRPMAEIRATGRGFVLEARGAGPVAVLAPPVEDKHASVLALLGDGEAWSSSALAVALGTSSRTIQRALEQLAADGKALPLNRGRSQRWVAASPPGFPTSLLLPAPPPGS